MSQPSVNTFFQARKKGSKSNAKKALFGDSQTVAVNNKEKKLLNLDNEAVKTVEQKSTNLPKPILETALPKRVENSGAQSPLKLKALPGDTKECQSSPLKRDLTQALLESPAKKQPFPIKGVERVLASKPKETKT